MKAKFILLDFLNLIFLFILILFVLVYIVLGDRMEIFQQIFKSLIPLSYYGFIVVLYIEYKKRKIKKQKYEDSLNEELFYLTDLDRIKDLVVIFFIILVDIVITVFNKNLKIDDLLQLFFVLLISLLLHYYIFKEEHYSQSAIATRMKIIYSEIVIVLMPVIMYLSVYMIGNVPSFMDIIQSITPMLLFYLWHIFLFKKNLPI